LNLGWVKWKEEDQVELPPLENGVEAILDRSERASFFATANDAAARLWRSKDLTALATFFHTKPVMFKVIGDQRANGEKRYPRLASATFEIPNKHLEYVLTWYQQFVFAVSNYNFIRYGLSAATFLMAFLKR
jgi:cytochrome oxidase assembly protein ShyY1